MTTQYAVFKGLPTGMTLTKKVFTAATPDTEVTGITGANTERTNAKGEYVLTITKSAVISGIHTIILFVGSTPIATGSRTFAGTDGETATTTPETAELDSSSVTAVQSGLATSASITTLRGADNDTLKTISDQIDGISSGGTDWTANERTAIRSILGVPASGTTPADPAVGILDTIRDSVGTYINGIAAVASTTTGTIVGFPSSLNIGDSYTEEANSDIHVFIRDENDDPITAVGDFNFTDPEFAPEVNITQSGSTGRVKAVVTFVEASPEDYLKVEIPSSQSRRASPGTATIQCLLKWVDTDGKVLCQKTLSKQAVTWNEMV